ncbi:MAG: GNAT family N-acetyltransferase [Bacteroides sp.]
MCLKALDGLHIGELELRRTTRPIELLEIVKIYESSFPFAERRSIESMSEAISSSSVCFFRIYRAGSCIGMLHCWCFSHVVYCEHFAIAQNFRNQRYGQMVLRTLLASAPKPLLLEVEPPTDELTQRRINFYEREGLSIVKTDYMQPPYHPSLPPLPLYLLSNEPQLSPKAISESVLELLAQVYRTEDRMKK